MKKLYPFLACTSFILLSANCDARPADFVFSNSISVHNIRAMQHSIMTNTIQTYEGTMSSALGMRKNLHLDDITRAVAAHSYGQMALYGKMPLYGEFNDDGSETITLGHNGGDTGDTIFNSLWANWQHFYEKEKFTHIDTIDSDYDIITLGLAGGHAQLIRGLSHWGLFGGYTGGFEETGIIKIEEHGGYVGFFSGYNLNDFSISAAVNVGTMHNTATDDYHTTKKYGNSWFGAMAHATYNFKIDNTFVIQPELYAEYMLADSANLSVWDAKITNKNFSSGGFTPGIRAIKHIHNDWFGTVGIHRVISWETGGDTKLNDTHVSKLKSDNYTEYGIGIEKSIDMFNIAFHINRRDGGRSGWNGGTSLKYIF